MSLNLILEEAKLKAQSFTVEVWAFWAFEQLVYFYLVLFLFLQKQINSLSSYLQLGLLVGFLSPVLFLNMPVSCKKYFQKKSLTR